MLLEHPLDFFKTLSLGLRDGQIDGSPGHHRNNAKGNVCDIHPEHRLNGGQREGLTKFVSGFENLP